MKNKSNLEREPSSFRDPNGTVFYSGQTVVRHVTKRYKSNLDFFISSGLSKKLIDQKYLLDFKLSTPRSGAIKDNEVIAMLESPRLSFISYPYEWSFSQLQDAALLTLTLQQLALEHGMILKDASAYNIQFVHGKPLLIDTLSFERYKEGEPWVAYQQFCQHFLGPLLLRAQVDEHLSRLQRTFIDGIPLNLVSRLLPRTTYFNPGILSHIHLHARNQNKYSAKANGQNAKRLPKQFLLGIVDNLRSTISKLTPLMDTTEWGEYYTFTNYSSAAFEAKKQILSKFLSTIKPKTVWDLGGNTGEFSRVASEAHIETVCFDIDPQAVEKNYLQVKQQGEKNLLPLLFDLTNPSPDIGWANLERKSLAHRGPADMVLALALIHHLAISNNLPFEYIAKYFSTLGKYLVIEFVPKSDSKVQTLLTTREDIFDQYTQDAFEATFKKRYSIVEKVALEKGSKRTLYLLKAKK